MMFCNDYIPTTEGTAEDVWEKFNEDFHRKYGYGDKFKVKITKQDLCNFEYIYKCWPAASRVFLDEWQTKMKLPINDEVNIINFIY